MKRSRHPPIRPQQGPELLGASFQHAVAAAVDHYSAGRFAEAEREGRTALVLAPSDPSALNILAGVAMESGRTDEAISLFKRALSGQPRNPFIQFNLGETYRRGGMLDKALACFERAATLKPDFAEALALAGDMLRALQRPPQALRHYRRVLSAEPTHARALLGLGLLLLERGDAADAAEHFAAALRSVPERHALRASLLSNFGLAQVQMGKGAEGLEALAEAVRAAPEVAAVWRLLAIHLRDTRIVPAGAQFRSTLLDLFARDDVNPRDLATAALAALAQNESVRTLLARVEAEPSATDRLLDTNADAAARLVHDPLFLALLANAPIANVPVELILVELRRALLRSIAASTADIAADFPLALCVARQSFLNEYVHFVRADETEMLERLIASLDREDFGVQPGDAIGATIAAAYRPLSDMPIASRLSAERHPALADLIRAQIEEPEREAQLRQQLPILRPIVDRVSLAVQEQYQQSPYPRWTRRGLDEPLSFRAAVGAALPHLPMAQIPNPERPRILVAGCGTGLEIMNTANMFSAPSILAIDLSATSLGYAMRKAEEHDLSDVEFLQADIIDLSALADRFDMITSFGVLHHMDDPARGLQVLAGLLKPTGLMRIGLYSAIGRQPIVQARAFIADAHYQPDPEGIRALRRGLMTQRPPELEAVLSPASDFWTMSDCRDLLFHVNEHHFTLPEVGTLLDDAGLHFLGLQFARSDDRSRYLAGHSSPRALQDIAALHRYELDHPDLFGDTYRIWARPARR